ncbi:hypothetical protein BD408DRAFT_451051 [Parasitella parasitica]|nr:hypothetical protein BD408DRAFT_451051 [Parasitella parasitica]
MTAVRGIGSFGSTAMLVSCMTVSFKLICLTTNSGWAAPYSALFICEALSSIHGNETFQAKVELTTIAQVYLGTSYHYFFQVMLFVSLQSVNIASIIIAAQTFDSMFIAVFRGSCGLGVYPGDWFCVSQSSGFDGYYIFTFGFLLTALLVIPMGFFSLVENIAVQITLFVLLAGILAQWVAAFVQQGFDPSLLPAGGSNSSMVLGIIIFNYSFITTKRRAGVKRQTNTDKKYILGICGAMAYKMDATSDIISILSENGSTAPKVTAYLFPVCAFIPVFTIVIRSNFLRGEICSLAWALFWSNLFPWLFCIPLQTEDWVNTIQNWSCLFFQSFPVLQNHDDNDVKMFIPDDNYSISNKRSSIKPSKYSQLEAAARSPTIDKPGLPTIVYSTIVTCTILSLSILFVIIYDLAMLGLGTDVFG